MSGAVIGVICEVLGAGAGVYSATQAGKGGDGGGGGSSSVYNIGQSQQPFIGGSTSQTGVTGPAGGVKMGAGDQGQFKMNPSTYSLQNYLSTPGSQPTAMPAVKATPQMGGLPAGGGFPLSNLGQQVNQQQGQQMNQQNMQQYFAQLMNMLGQKQGGV